MDEALLAAIRTAFSLHHDTGNERLEAIEHALHHIRNQNERIIEMSETADTAFADISAKVDSLANAITQLGTDVAADIAALGSGTLNATQQAAADSIKQKIDAIVASVQVIDATTKPAPVV